MEHKQNILHYGNTICISKELKSYLLNAMNEYTKKFQKKSITLYQLENNKKLIKDITIDEEHNRNEDIFLKIQRKKFCVYDLFNMSLLFPLKVDYQNKKPHIQLVSDEMSIVDIEKVQSVVKDIEQTKIDKLKCFQLENVITELLDEIIRQIMNECQKRGMALILINNELDKQMNKYKQLIKILDHNNDMNVREFNQAQEQYNNLLKILSNEEMEWRERIPDLKYELDVLKEKNKKKLLKNKTDKEIQYDLLKHNEFLLEKIRETYDRKGEI